MTEVNMTFGNSEDEDLVEVYILCILAVTYLEIWRGEPGPGKCQMYI